jgi:hypothetical protein
MKLAKYIQELLLDNETVIIPGFGAFISTYKPAEIKGNEIIPPSKDISFSTQFRNNDGLLVANVAKRNKLSQINALKRIEKERENMLYQLDKGETVTLENIGILFNDEKNEIQFTPFKDDNLMMDSFGFETITVADAVEKPEETEPSKDFAEEIPVIEETEINTESENADKSESEITAPVTETEPVSHNEVISENEKEIEKIKLPRPLPDWAIVKPVERKKTNKLWYLLILIPIFIAGYFVFRNNNNPNKTENSVDQTVKNEQEGIQIQTIPPIDSIQNDSVQNTEVETVKNLEPQVSLSEGNSKYYIVGGGFKSEENAEKYIVRLKEKGIEGIMLGKMGNMNLVGIAAYDTEQEAYNALNRKIKENPGWNLWVYKK